MIWPAFLVGFLGSVHCIGMCGPIALSLPIKQGKNRYVGISLYNLGRIITYGIFGLLFGGLGSLFALSGLQQFLSISSGVFLLLMLGLSLMGNSGFQKVQFFGSLIHKLKSKLGVYLHRCTFSSLFVIGVLNGLLPCGLIYVAVIGAMATGSFLEGSFYMMLFGLGTVPAMFMVAVSGNFIRTKWRYKFTKTIPLVVGVMGLVLILRGLNLGIPYLSPNLSSENPATSTCCTKK